MKEVMWGFTFGEGTIECECDNCGQSFVYEFYDNFVDFQGCQEEMKSEGWKAKKIDGDWYDFCCEQCYYEWIKKHK